MDGVMGLRFGFININDMYNNDVGKRFMKRFMNFGISINKSKLLGK